MQPVPDGIWAWPTSKHSPAVTHLCLRTTHHTGPGNAASDLLIIILDGATLCASHSMTAARFECFADSGENEIASVQGTILGILGFCMRKWIIVSCLPAPDIEVPEAIRRL